MRDESYEAGYRAGHLQGWVDAMAKVEAAQRPQPRRGHGSPAAAPPAPAPAGPERPTPARPTFVAPAGPERPTPAPPTFVAPSAAAAPQSAAVPAAPPAAAAAQVLRQVPAETPAERDARRARRDRQNINVTLYVASLLLVAAAALFVGTGLPPMLRFAGVCAVTGMFYGAGLVLHSRTPRLKPAAVAFAGTGLALVPVAGLALYNFALHHGPTAWLITSLIGTAAYMAAAVRLESRVLVYLSLTFVASTAWSGVAVLGGALVWYFAILIGVAVLFTLLAMARPGWLPPIYAVPLMALHPFVVPAVATAATCVAPTLAKSEYALIIGMCGAYFALMAAAPGSRLKLANFYAARTSLTVAVCVETWHVTGRGSDAFLAAAAVLAVQGVGVAFGLARLDAWFPAPAGRRPQADGAGAPGRVRWVADALVTFSIQLLATMLFAVPLLAGAILARGTVPQDGMIPLWVPVLLLLTTGFALAVKLGGAAEWAPAASLLLAGILAPAIGARSMAGMLALAAVFWALRSRRNPGHLRGRFVLAARVAVTLAVPFAVAAFPGTGPDRMVAAALGLLVALVLQQLVSALLMRTVATVFAPEPSLAGFGAAGLLALVALPFIDPTSGSSWTWAAVVVQLFAALATGWLLLPRPAAAGEWRATVGEALPLLAAGVAASVAFLAVGQAAGNLALVLVVAYVHVSALRLPARQHRWTYWWLGRGVATVLLLTAFDQLQDAAGATVIAGDIVRPAAVLAVALGLQLSLPLAAAVRGRAPRGLVVDAGAVLLFQLAASVWLLWQEGDGWQPTLAAALAAVCAAAAGYVLRSRPASAWFAPAALAVLLVFSGGHLPVVELVLGIFAAFAAAMVAAVGQPVGRGWYFVAARVLTAALAAVLSYDVTASPAAVSVTFALVLCAQHAVRWLLRSRLAGVPFQQAAVWITLAGQALLPLLYASPDDAFRATQNDGGRWVVLLELALLLVSAVAASRLFAARGSLYFAVYAALFAVLSLGPLVRFAGDDRAGSGFLADPLLNHTGTAVTLLAVAAAAVGAGVLRRGRNAAVAGPDHWLWLVAAAAFALTALIVSPLAADWVAGAALLMLAAVCFAASHVERQPVLYAPAVIAVLAGTTAVAAAVVQAVPGEWGQFLPWLGGAGTGAAALYAVRLWRSGPLAGDLARRGSLAGAAFLGLCLVAAAGVQADATSWVAAAALTAAAAVACFEAPAPMRRLVAEAGTLAVVAAAQRAAIFRLDGPGGYSLPDPFWVAQWYVLLGAGMGVLRLAAGQRKPGRLLVGAAAGLLNLSGLGVVFGGTGAQQLWVLVVFAALLAAGLVLADRLFVWWGAAGVAACVLWAMRQYTFALLALVAVGLIAFAVWRLNRTTAAEKVAMQATGSPAVPDQPGGGDPFSKR
ncbi:MAG: hypothetical protein JWQ75_2524 [Pseudarthrobacter sp.]|nr:hypothetical protein [Pseudarthrobacter sp.]